jgi:hypothetical protein
LDIIQQEGDKTDKIVAPSHHILEDLVFCRK